ncbi:hypothetical protein MC885_019639 [Smutsia gigantea]|nr:hypothetical protein MC885_019639 [Smutsia gigantea]
MASALSQVDNAYWLWTFQGCLLQKNNKDLFCQLLWRPRPATLLSQDQIKVWCPTRPRGMEIVVALRGKPLPCYCQGGEERGMETGHWWGEPLKSCRSSRNLVGGNGFREGAGVRQFEAVLAPI